MNRPSLSVVLTALLLALPLAAAAQLDAPLVPPSDKVAEARTKCDAVLAKPFDGGLDPRIQPDCDATAWYYGIGRDKDYPTARACAFIERFQHVDKDGSLFTGPGILSMVFANGEGTPRDLDLARRFVCENKEADAFEIAARLDLIDRIAANPQRPRHFDLCATASSGPSLGWCASLQLRIDDTKRYDTLVKMVDGLTLDGQNAFKTLQTAEQNFEAARVAKELDQTGTAASAQSLQEQDRIRALFVSDFALFAKPDYAQPFKLAVIEPHLDEDLAVIHANGPRIFRNTTITSEGVDETQRAWLKYRDAFVAYEKVVNPTVSSDAIATQLSRERLAHLHKLKTTF